MKEPDYYLEQEDVTVWIDEMREHKCRVEIKAEDSKLIISATDELSEAKDRDLVIIEIKPDIAEELIEFLKHFTKPGQ
jgi:hypothetical protein